MMSGRWIRQLPLSRGDKALIVILLLLGVAGLFLIRSIVSPADVAVVETDGRPFCRLDLSVDTRRAIPGPLGETVIEVRDRRIRIAASPCPHKVCVRTGWIGRSGRMIVCLPNRVVVRIEGDAGVDAVSW
jgi:hypothetical protein